MLTSDKFYRSFVLLPCEICVVPFGHRKIAADWNDIPLAKMKSTVVGLTHACASLCSFKHGYLSLQKYSLQQYFIKKLPLPILLHNLRIYPSKNTPYSVAFSEKAPPFRFLTSQSSWQIGCRFSIASDTPRHNRAYASQAPLGTVAGQPGLRPVRMHNYTDGKKEPYLLVWFFFSNRQLSILPGRFQPSTFDV